MWKYSKQYFIDRNIYWIVMLTWPYYFIAEINISVQLYYYNIIFNETTMSCYHKIHNRDQYFFWILMNTSSVQGQKAYLSTTTNHQTCASVSGNQVSLAMIACHNKLCQSTSGSPRWNGHFQLDDIISIVISIIPLLSIWISCFKRKTKKIQFRLRNFK